MILNLTTTSYYFLNGVYYLLEGERLIQFDQDYYLEIKPGNEFYGWTRRRLGKMVPIPDHQGEEVLEKLKHRITELFKQEC